jgi:hypothetical protein
VFDRSRVLGRCGISLDCSDHPIAALEFAEKIAKLIEEEKMRQENCEEDQE